MSIHELIARSLAAQRELAREHSLFAFMRGWWVQASSLALALLLVERFGFFGSRMDVRTAFTTVLSTGALVAGARAIGWYWTERRRVAGDT